MTFTFDGVELEYFDHSYNATLMNERAVEIPLARRFIAEHGIDLEIGNVLRHYGHYDHKVVDRYELDPMVENLDVFDIAGHFGSIVTISTLEHVRWDEPERHALGAIDALEHLRSICDHLFVTVPMGHNLALDGYLLRSRECDGYGSTLVRENGGWEQTQRYEWRPYGVATPWAESVWIGEFC